MQWPVEPQKVMNAVSVLFLRCGEQIHNHFCQVSSEFHVLKITKIVRF